MEHISERGLLGTFLVIHDLFYKTGNFLIVFGLLWAPEEVTKETPLAASEGGEHGISDLDNMSWEHISSHQENI